MEDSRGLYTYTFTLSDDATRATIGVEDGKKVINWESGDRLGVYAVGADNTSYNRYADIDLEKTPNEFKISSYMALVEGDMIYAYAPYVKFSSDNGEDWKSPTTVPLSIPAAQVQKGTAFDADAMPKVSIPYSMPEALAAQTDKPVGDIKMVNLGAIIDFKIYSSNSSYAKEKVLSVSFEATTALVGDFVFDLTGVNYSDASTMAIKDYTEKTVKTTVTSPSTLGSEKASAYDVYMVIAPGTYSGNVIVETNEATYTYPVEGKTFNRNTIHNLGVNLRGDVREQIVNYVTLDWTFPEEEGSSAILADLNEIVGVKTYGLGTYAEANAPYQIQFNGDNDNIQVKTDVAIGAVSLDYKMIGGGNTSYFDIYESTDGMEWGEAIQRLTIAGGQNSTGTVATTEAFSSSSRYVKINFVKGSNVGVGKISITKPNTDPIIVASDIANVSAVGVTAARASYEARNFTDDVKVASYDGCVTAATITEGAIVYSVGANYESTAHTGTIKLQSESTPTITKTINVGQLGSTLSVSLEVVTIPADAEEASFTITSPEFGWTISSNSTDVLFDESGSASADPSVVTVMSEVEAGEEVQTLATLTIVRKEGDPQQKQVVVKKAKATVAGELPAGTVLWAETFDSFGGSGTDFSKLTTLLSEYTYTGRSGYGDNATSVTLSNTDGNVKPSTASATNMTDGHLWFNKSTNGTVTTSAIKLYGATSLVLTYSQATSGSLLVAGYSVDGGTSWTDFDASGPAASNEYSFTVQSGTSSVLLRFVHASTNAKNTRFDNPSLTVGE